MKVLIIEDEREIARNLAEDLRGLRPQIDIVGMVSDIAGAVKIIDDNPDLNVIFADIMIDDGMSFKIFEQVNTNAMVVFTTAYDEFALKAFDYNCVDYLLKPISLEGLERALARYDSHRNSIRPDNLCKISSEIASRNIGYRKKILLERGADLVIRNVDELCYSITERGYVTACFKDGFKAMVNNTLTSLSESLDPSKFIRISRQVLVNLDCIDRISHGDGRDYVVKLKPPYVSESFEITAETRKKILLHF